MEEEKKGQIPEEILGKEVALYYTDEYGETVRIIGKIYQRGDKKYIKMVYASSASESKYVELYKEEIDKLVLLEEGQVVVDKNEFIR